MTEELALLRRDVLLVHVRHQFLLRGKLHHAVGPPDGVHRVKQETERVLRHSQQSHYFENDRYLQGNIIRNFVNGLFRGSILFNRTLLSLIYDLLQ